MKKNLVSVLILALIFVNVILTAIMMITVTGTMKKTSRLIDGISTALSLEVGNPTGTDEKEPEAVSMGDTVVYKIEEEMTIPLAIGVDGKEHFCLVSVSLSMNAKAEGYKEYGATIAEKEDLIKGEIVSVIGSYSIEEAKGDTDAMRADILDRIQTMYDSEFIYNVVFREVIFQ